MNATRIAVAALGLLALPGLGIAGPLPSVPPIKPRPAIVIQPGRPIRLIHPIGPGSARPVPAPTNTPVPVRR